MITGYHATYRAKSVEQARSEALTRWRDVVGNPEEELPLGTSLLISADDDGLEVDLDICISDSGARS